MNLLQLIQRVRSMTRDFSGSTFRTQDIKDFVNEAIDRVHQVFPALNSLVYLDGEQESVLGLPSAYHSLLATYSASRCFTQDDRHYQATTLMNEFEQKLDELRLKVDDGQVVLRDNNAVDITTLEPVLYVKDNYFLPNETNAEASFDYPDDEDMPSSGVVQPILIDEVDGGVF